MVGGGGGGGRRRVGEARERKEKKKREHCKKEGGELGNQATNPSLVFETRPDTGKDGPESYG